MQNRSGSLARVFLVLTLLTALYLVILVTRPSEALFGVKGDWVWNGHPPSPATYARWWPAIVVLIVFLAGSIGLDRVWERTGKRVHVAGLLFLMVTVVALQVLLKHIHYRFPLEYYLYRAIGPSDGFWQVAVSIESIGDYLRSYPEQMVAVRDFTIHPPVHPPGNIVYLWAWRQVFEALPGAAQVVAHGLRAYHCDAVGFVTLRNAQIAATLGHMMMVPFSALTIPALYAFGKKLGGTRAGWRAAALYVVVPAATLFTARWDTVHPVFLITALGLFHVALERERSARWLAPAVLVSLMTFCSFGNVSFALALGFYALAYLWLYRDGKVWRPWRGWLAMVVGGFSVWIVYQALTGVSFMDVLSTSMDVHFDLNEGRRYWPWLLYNVYDLIVFAGVPVGVLFVAAVVRAWPRLLKRDEGQGLPLVVAISATLVTLSLLGLVRGEQGRMWLPWMAGMCVVAALGLRRQGSRPWPFGLLLLLMAIQAFMSTLYLRASSPMMPAYERRTPIAAIGEIVPAHPLDVRLGEDIRLLGYDLEPGRLTPEKPVQLTLYWGAEDRPDIPYTVFVHVLDEEGRPVAQHDGFPVMGEVPTTCWLPNELIPDSRTIPLPAGIVPGDYRLVVGMYYLPTMERANVTENEQEDSVTLPVELSVE